MPDRWVRTVALTVVILVVSACGGSPVTSPLASASSAASSAAATADSSAPSGGATVEQAAAAYLAFVTDWNAKTGVVNAQFDAAGDDPVKVGAAWTAFVAVDQAYIAGIDAIDFPASVIGAVQAIRDATDERIRIEQALAADPTNLQLVDEMSAQAGSVAAAGAALRGALGLPPAVAASPAP